MISLRFLVGVFAWVATGVLAAGNIVSRGPWTGAVTEDSAVVVAKLSAPNPDVVLELSESADFARPVSIKRDAAHAGDLPEVARFSLRGLKPATHYHYRFLGGLQRDRDRNR